MKFLCDQMLGTLAKWLRICGFDTFYANAELTDDKLLEIAKKENRKLITRDKELFWAGKRENLDVIKITSTELDEQLRQVLQGASLDNSLVLSRCLLCNSTLDSIKKDEVKGKVPPKVFEQHETFWYCSCCDKIYWRGTHYKDMLEKIDEL